jgi:hypothetical protein
MIDWSPRTLVIDRFRLDYESAETNGLVCTDDLEVTHFQMDWNGRDPLPPISENVALDD